MQPTLDLDSDLLDNEDRFTDPFFQRFSLRPGPPLRLSDTVTKTYRFPTFYGDVTCAIAIFLCDYRRAAAIMPHPTMKPVKMTRGRAVVLFSCYVYRNVMNVRPYNEIAMTIPVMVGGGFQPPVLPLIMDFARKGFYVFSMPVTSLENQIRGTRIWGLPKVVEEIDVSTEGTHCVTTARDDSGVVYFELSVPMEGKAKRFDETGYLYSVHEGELLKSQTCFAGDFQMNANPGLLFRHGRDGEPPALRLGDSPRAAPLKELEIEPEAFQFRFCRSMNSCFDLPLPRQE